MTVLTTLIPEGTVTWIVKVVCAFALAGTGENVMTTVGAGTGMTVTAVDTVLVFPDASETVPVTT
jgi:hypothetical protein